MRRPLALATCLALAACLQPSPDPVGEVEIGADRYPITVDSMGNWRMRIDGRSVICSRATEVACYWSARHFLNAQSLLDDYG